MARDFSPITFFQRTPNALLGCYFHEKPSTAALKFRYHLG